MKSTKEIKKTKEKRLNSSLLRKFLLAFLIVLPVVFILNLDKLSPGNISQWLSDTENVSGGFPYSMGGSSAIQITNTPKNLVVLTDNSMICLNHSAKEILKVQHKYGSPCIATDNKMILLYDRGGTGYTVAKGGEKLFAGTCEANIIAGDIAKNGTFALATDSSEGRAKLIFYSKRNKRISDVTSSDEYITRVKLNSNATRAIISTFNVKNTVRRSSIYIFDVESGKVVSSIEYDNYLIIDFHYNNNGSMTVLTDKAVSFVSKANAKTREVSFEGCQLLRYDISSEGEVAAAIELPNSQTGTSLIFVRKNGELGFKADFEDKIKWVDAEGSVSALLKDRIIKFNPDGKTNMDLPTSASTVKFIEFGNKIYIQNVGYIEMLKAD